MTLKNTLPQIPHVICPSLLRYDNLLYRLSDFLPAMPFEASESRLFWEEWDDALLADVDTFLLRIGEHIGKENKIDLW